jgi:divalent metal cation (Fe/Co/Zn/Cd) transporter
MKSATAAPDEGHPYGHVKFETLTAFAIAGFLFGVCYQEMHLHLSNEFGRDHIASHTIIEEVEQGWSGNSEKSRRLFTSNHCRMIERAFCYTLARVY